jgi:alkylhydroperoxidase family enzyme
LTSVSESETLGKSNSVSVSETREAAVPRIEPLSAPYDQPVAQYLAAATPAGQEPINLFRTLAVNLEMAGAMSAWARHELGRRLAISLREREILIDRTCARCRCEYEWGVHVAYFGQRAGLDQAQVRSLTFGSATDPCWDSEAERLLIRVADELHERNDVRPRLWDLLTSHYSSAQLLDIVMLCGWYHAISFVGTACAVDLESWAPTFAEYAVAAAEDRRPG